MNKALFSNFDCGDYLVDEFAKGYYDDESYLQLVYAFDEVNLSDDSHVLFIGSAGADGIEFCYRLNKKGIWAYYPIDDEFKYIARDINELISGWQTGSIFV